MREIKFRAWDKETKEMSYDFLNKNWLKVCIASPYVELMQFTGLYDDLDNEIYEGDIIRIHNGEYEVKWDKYQFILVDFYSSSNDTPCDYFSERSGETVIGNIYENPELLTVMNT